MLKRLIRYSLLVVLALQATPGRSQTTDPRLPPAALPAGSYFPPTVPPPPPTPTASVAPVEYLPSELTSSEEEFPPRLWIDSEFMVWRVRNGTLLGPLATTGNTTNLGIPLQPGTQVQFGPQVDYDNITGYRITAGVWYDDDHIFGLDGGFWQTEHTTIGVSLRSGDNPTGVIARPFIDISTGAENVRLVAFPGAFSGQLDVSSSFKMWGAEFNPVVLRLRNTERSSLYGIIGFRYFDLDERIAIIDSSTTLTNGVASFQGRAFGQGSRIGVADIFEAGNQYYAGQIGLRYSAAFNRLFFNSSAKLGIGSTNSVLNVSGITTAQTRPTMTRPLFEETGILAGVFNSRRETTAKFALMPELSAQVGFQITDRLSVFAGYTFIYLSSVLRPENQIVRFVNTSLVQSSPSFNANPPGFRQPFPVYQRVDFSAHSITFGLSFRY